MNIINNILKLNGIKITPHKIAILELFYKYRHIDALQIISRLKLQGINISLATVYRNLLTLEEHNIITKHNFGNDHSVYELKIDKQHHDHLICIKCNQVIEFSNQLIEQLQLEVAKQNNFKITDHTLNIYGLCKNCAK